LARESIAIDSESICKNSFLYTFWFTWRSAGCARARLARNPAGRTRAHEKCLFV